MAARGLVGREGAMVEASHRVLGELDTLLAKRASRAVFRAAVDRNHCPNGLFFTVNARRIGFHEMRQPYGNAVSCCNAMSR